MIEINKFYLAEIKYHRTDDLKQGALPNGSIIHVRSADMDGQVIFYPAEHPLWISEKDLIFIKEITPKEYYSII